MEHGVSFGMEATNRQRIGNEQGNEYVTISITSLPYPAEPSILRARERARSHHGAIH